MCGERVVVCLCGVLGSDDCVYGFLESLFVEVLCCGDGCNDCVGGLI